MKPINQAHNAEAFIADKRHEEFHDHYLWDLRKARDGQRDKIPAWHRGPAFPKTGQHGESWSFGISVYSTVS